MNRRRQRPVTIIKRVTEGAGGTEYVLTAEKITAALGFTPAASGSGGSGSPTTISWNSVTDKPAFFNGDYNSLTNKPALFDGTYASLTGKPALFSGNYNDLTNRPTLFDGTYASLTGKPALFSGSYTDLTNKPTLFDGTWLSLTGKPTFHAVATSGSYADLTNKPTLFDGTWASLSGKPTTFTPTAHTHAISEVTNLQTTLDGKAGTSVATTSANGLMASTDKSKLDGIAAGATANSPDSSLIARANHSGTQSISTILASGGLKIFGRVTNSAGNGEELTPTQVMGMMTSVNHNTTGTILGTGTGGVGYGTGAGGAVTQATNRTTGVTLSKMCGAITLFSKTTTANLVESFTVTNTLVAVGDTINVSVRATGIFLVFVTNVAAGSFRVSVFTPAATTAEAPVIHFAVIKAVTA